MQTFLPARYNAVMTRKPKSSKPEVNSKDHAVGHHVDRLREWRNPTQSRPAFEFLAKQVQREIITPHKKLGKIRDAWLELLPPHLEERTQLLSLQRYVLRVGVSDHATLYELQQTLSSGLQDQLSNRLKMNFKQIRLQIMPELDLLDDMEKG